MVVFINLFFLICHIFYTKLHGTRAKGWKDSRGVLNWKWQGIDFSLHQLMPLNRIQKHKTNGQLRVGMQVLFAFFINSQESRSQITACSFKNVYCIYVFVLRANVTSLPTILCSNIGLVYKLFRFLPFENFNNVFIMHNMGFATVL